MPWLDHGIHSVAVETPLGGHGMDCRVKPGNDDKSEERMPARLVASRPLLLLHRLDALSIAACSAPYLSQTGFMASWKRFFSSAEISVMVDAVRLHVVDRGLLLRHPQLALLLLRLLGELRDERLILRRKRIPDLLGEDQDLRDHQMAGRGVIWSVVVVLAGRVARIVVLRAVDDAGLQAR